MVMYVEGNSHKREQSHSLLLLLKAKNWGQLVSEGLTSFPLWARPLLEPASWALQPQGQALVAGLLSTICLVASPQVEEQLLLHG